MIRCLMKYADNPTYISTSVVKQWETDIPIITICPFWNTGYKEDVLLVSPTLPNNNYAIKNYAHNKSTMAFPPHRDTTWHRA